MSFYFSWWKEKKHLGTGSLPFHHGPDQKGIVVSGLGVPLQLCGKQCMCVLALFFLRKQTVAQATGKCRRESLCGFGPTLVVGRNMWVWKLWQLSLHMRRIETVTWHKLKGRWSRCTNICPYLLWTATSWDAKSPLGWLWLDAPWLHQLVQVQVLCYLLPKCPEGKAPYQDLAFTWTSCLPQTKKGVQALWQCDNSCKLCNSVGERWFALKHVPCRLHAFVSLHLLSGPSVESVGCTRLCELSLFAILSTQRLSSN